MIHGSKSMIAECIDRMRKSGCDGCDRQEACADLFRRLGLRMQSAPYPERRPAQVSPFVTIFREIAKAIEARAAAKPVSTAFRREAEKKLEPLLAAGEARMEALARALGCPNAKAPGFVADLAERRAPPPALRGRPANPAESPGR